MKGNMENQKNKGNMKSNIFFCFANGKWVSKNEAVWT